MPCEYQHFSTVLVFIASGSGSQLSTKATSNDTTIVKTVVLLLFFIDPDNHPSAQFSIF
jgi:hypothetical protein